MRQRQVNDTGLSHGATMRLPGAVLAIVLSGLVGFAAAGF